MRSGFARGFMRGDVGALELDRARKDATIKQLTAQRAKLQGELEAREHQRVPVVSFCRGIDELLEGGAKPGKVLEVCGGPGAGKTQLLLQLCVDATIPQQFCGAGGASVFIDADGSFAPSRCAQLAKEEAKGQAEGAAERADLIIAEATRMLQAALKEPAEAPPEPPEQVVSLHV